MELTHESPLPATQTIPTVRHVLADGLRPAAFAEFTVAPGFGDATTSLEWRLDETRTIAVFARRSFEGLARKLEHDPNLPFKVWNTPLFPLANRLRGRADEPEVHARIAGVAVTAPKNHRGGGIRSEDTHLHGLAFSARPNSTRVRDTAEEISRESVFRDFFRGYWQSDAELTIRQTLTAREFRYEMRARNVGNADLPVGFGSHPYFQAPSGEESAIEIRVPAGRVARIDNLDDVFPTGEWIELSEENSLDFNLPRGIAGSPLDHFFTDLEPDANGFPSVELIDRRAGVTYRMSATTRNVIGVQVYYPGHGAIVAIELVTHYPDPRAEVWGTAPTGIQVLRPGESAEYGYRVEVAVEG